MKATRQLRFQLQEGLNDPFSLPLLSWLGPGAVFPELSLFGMAAMGMEFQVAEAVVFFVAVLVVDFFFLGVDETLQSIFHHNPVQEDVSLVPIG